MGPLVSEEQFARVTGYIESGKKRGRVSKQTGRTLMTMRPDPIFHASSSPLPSVLS